MHALTFTPATLAFDDLATFNGDDYYWSARDLMPKLGYSKWQEFDRCVRKAKDSLLMGAHKQNSEADFQEFEFDVPVGRGGTRTQPAKDFWLNRPACYLVAMECDVRKPEVKSAKDYFVHQTIFAEQVQAAVVTQAVVQDRVFSMPATLSEALDQTMLALQGWKETAVQLETTKAKLDAAETTLEVQALDVSFSQEFKASNFSGNMCLTDVAKHLGVPVRTFFSALRELGIIWKRSVRDRPHADYVEKGWFKGVAQLDKNDVSHMTFSVTPAGVVGIREKLLKSSYAKFVSNQTKLI